MTILPLAFGSDWTASLLLNLISQIRVEWGQFFVFVEQKLDEWIYFSLGGSLGQEVPIPLVVDINIFDKLRVIDLGCG